MGGVKCTMKRKNVNEKFLFTALFTRFVYA